MVEVEGSDGSPLFMFLFFAVAYLFIMDFYNTHNKRSILLLSWLCTFNRSLNINYDYHAYLVD